MTPSLFSRFRPPANPLSLCACLLLLLGATAWAEPQGDGWQKVFVQDPGFEAQELGKWWLNGSQRAEGKAQEGTYAVEVTSPGTGVVSNFPLEVKPNDTLRLEFWVQSLSAEDAVIAIRFNVREFEGNKPVRVEESKEVNAGADSHWHQVAVEVKVPDYDGDTQYTKLDLKSAGGQFLLDNISAWRRPAE